LFSVNTTEKYFGQKFRSLCTKTPNSYKPTHDDLFLHPKDPHIIFVILLLFFINTVKKMLVIKVQYLLNKNLSKMKTNSRGLCFSPISFAHNFRSFCICFTSIQLKNITVTSLGHLARKFPKVTNQHMMTCFSTQTILISFSVILLLFPTNMV